MLFSVLRSCWGGHGGTRRVTLPFTSRQVRITQILLSAVCMLDEACSAVENQNMNRQILDRQIL